MIDPDNIINYDYNDNELEEFLLEIRKDEGEITDA